MRRLAGLPLVLVCGAICADAQAGERRAAPALTLGSSLGGSDQIGDLLAQATPAADAAALDWRSTSVRLSPKSKLRIRMADPAVIPAPHAAPLAQDRSAYEVTLVRDWPGAVSFKSGKVGVDVSPHAAVGLTPYGGMAEAGARLELSQRKDDKVREGLAAIGVEDGARYDDQGRWYLFAAASGRAVGLNMLRNDAGLSRAGWTTDESSTLVGDAQVGVGWRKGAMQTSFGVLHREVKAEHAYYGYQSKADSVVAFSFAVRPGQ